MPIDLTRCHIPWSHFIKLNSPVWSYHDLISKSWVGRLRGVSPDKYRIRRDGDDLKLQGCLERTKFLYFLLECKHKHKRERGSVCVCVYTFFWRGRMLRIVPCSLRTVYHAIVYHFSFYIALLRSLLTICVCVCVYNMYLCCIQVIFEVYYNILWS